jgi:hypothetical protein
MAQRSVKVGQIWKDKKSGGNYIVTRVYSEALATYAVLRPAGAETEARIRVKVSVTGEGQSLPGYTEAQGPEDF